MFAVRSFNYLSMLIYVAILHLSTQCFVLSICKIKIRTFCFKMFRTRIIKFEGKKYSRTKVDHTKKIINSMGDIPNVCAMNLLFMMAYVFCISSLASKCKKISSPQKYIPNTILILLKYWKKTYREILLRTWLGFILQ